VPFNSGGENPRGPVWGGGAMHREMGRGPVWRSAGNGPVAALTGGAE
jgi:hypothetical protein